MIDQTQIARNWAQRGFSCDLWTDPPGQCWKDFVHDTDELVLVIAGQLEFEIEGETYHPGTGEELFIPSGACHSVRNIGGATARWLYGYRRQRDKGPSSRQA